MEQNEEEIVPEIGADVKIEPLKSEDILQLRPILETWIRDRFTGEIIEDEIEEILKSASDSLVDENSNTYLVAKVKDGKVVGMMGFRPPELKMLPFAKTSKPVELITAYVDKNARMSGVGRMLVEEIRSKATSQGYEELILNSGPRYKDSGWEFYDKLGFERVGVAEKMYGEDGDAQVWSKQL